MLDSNHYYVTCHNYVNTRVVLCIWQHWLGKMLCALRVVCSTRVGAGLITIYYSCVQHTAGSNTLASYPTGAPAVCAALGMLAQYFETLYRSQFRRIISSTREDYCARYYVGCVSSDELKQRNYSNK
jgi:hypothetical protein